MLPVIEVAGLGVHRGKIQILSGVQWSVALRQHWAILGANGSGKTTLLAALTGYVTPSEGKISVLGQVYGRSNWRELRQRIGIVSSSLRQIMPEAEPALYTVASGKLALIDFWGEPSTADLRKAKRILQFIGCKDLADRPWAYLSQGERQRVLIGRALMANPPLLILDEPCAGLDPAARENFLAFLEQLMHRRRSPTIILVTHHVEEIVRPISHVLILERGRIQSAGSKAEVLTSRNLSRAFKSSMVCRNVRGRFTLRIKRRRSGLPHQRSQGFSGGGAPPPCHAW